MAGLDHQAAYATVNTTVLLGGMKCTFHLEMDILPLLQGHSNWRQLVEYLIPNVHAAIKQTVCMPCA